MSTYWSFSLHVFPVVSEFGASHEGLWIILNCHLHKTSNSLHGILYTLISNISRRICWGDSFSQTISAHTCRSQMAEGVCIYMFILYFTLMVSIFLTLWHHSHAVVLPCVNVIIRRCALWCPQNYSLYSILFWTFLVFQVFLSFLVSNCDSKLQIFYCEAITWNNFRSRGSKTGLRHAWWSRVQAFERRLAGHMWSEWAKWRCNFGKTEVNVGSRRDKEERVTQRFENPQCLN